MFNKIKSYLKGQEYTTIESYFQGGYEVKIKEDEKGKQVVHLRDHMNNRLIEISQNDSQVKHEIYDGLRGITTVIEVPASVYKKVADETSN